MRIDISREQGNVIVSLHGKITLNESGRDFFKRMNELFDDEIKGIILIDMSHIDYIDSTGLGELVGYLHRLREKGRQMVLINPQKTIMNLIKLSNLDKIFPIFASIDEALHRTN